MDTTHTTTRTGHASLATAALLAGLVAAALTTMLSFISLVLTIVAFAAGFTAIRRGQAPTRAAVGMTAAAVSAWVIVLEIFVLGG